MRASLAVLLLSCASAPVSPPRPDLVAVPAGGGVTALQVMRTEVTQGQWARITGRSPAFFAACGPSCPVEQVNWYEAVTYANRLSEHEELGACYAISECSGTMNGACPGAHEADLGCMGDYRCTVVAIPGCAGYRLPTYGEWVWLARGPDGPLPGGEHLGEAWSISNSQAHPQPVGRLTPNRWGLDDTFGNVAEWIEEQTLLGGSWLERPTRFGLRLRMDVEPVQRTAMGGLRLVRTGR